MNVASKPLKKNASGSSNKKTLDIQHSYKIAQIQEVNSRIHQIKSELQSIKQDIEGFQSRKSEATEEEINAQLQRIDKKLDLEAELKKLQNEYDETQYYVNTADILYKYYDLLEKGNDNAAMANELVSNKNNSILKYFLGSAPKPSGINNETLSNLEDPDQSRGALLEKYLAFTDNNFVSSKVKECNERCGFCKSTNMTVMTNDGYAFCNDCFTMEYLIVDHDKPSYKDPPKEISYFAYKRINHFQEFSMQWAFYGLMKKLICIFKNYCHYTIHLI